MSKKTYKELGPDSWYQYGQQDVGKFKKMIISNTISSLNVISGDINGIAQMIESVDNIGSNIKELQTSCFYGCQNLKKINLPKTLRKIGDYSFKDCIQLSAIENNILIIPKNVGKSAFENCNFKDINLKTDIYQQSDINISNENDDYYFQEYNIGESIFNKNKNLSNLSIDNILLSYEMFNQCSSLSSIYFKEDSELLISQHSPFKECSSLTSISIPPTLTYYNELHPYTLKGSAIKEIHLKGFSEDEAKYATGEERTEYVLSTPVDLGEITTGTIYALYGQTDKVENDKTQQKLNELIGTVINKHIPLIIINQAGINNFIKRIVGTDNFMTWFKSKPCIMVIVSNYSGSREEYLMPNPEQRFDEPEYILKPGKCPGVLTIDENATIDYEKKDGQILKYHMIPVKENNSECGILKKTPYIEFTRNITTKHQLGFEEREKKKYIQFYQILSKNNQLTMQKKEFIEGEDIEKIHKFETDVMTALERKQSNSSYEQFKQKEWVNSQTFNTIMYDFMPLTYTTNRPTYIGWFWRKSDDITISNKYIKLTEREKKAFLNGEDIVLDTRIVLHCNDCYCEPVKMTLYFYRNDSKPNFGSFIINDKLIGYKAEYHLEPFLENSKFKGSKKSFSNQGIVVESNNIYIQTSKYLISENMKIDSSGRKIKYNVENTRYFINCIIEDLFQLNEEINYFVNYNIKTSKGNCWGIEHDCTVIDKDGNSHQFIYTPPTES